MNASCGAWPASREISVIAAIFQFLWFQSTPPSGAVLIASEDAAVGGVHPRASGGARSRGGMPAALRGPSPRERGSRSRPSRRPRGRGSIPARAGEPFTHRRSSTRKGVHPRASGGASGVQALPSGSMGPSPRERGSLEPVQLDDALAGSIPARAGEPIPQSRAWCRSRVHPRASGGATQPTVPARRAMGPSPRERGSRSGWPFSAAPGGSIPARAGEPSLQATCSPPLRVHPRASGGALTAQQLIDLNTGPSPRERGSPAPVGDHERRYGSIPARAGEPDRRLCRSREGEVHPRASGGALEYEVAPGSIRGPSPRERGSQ